MEYCAVGGFFSELPLISIVVPVYNVEKYLIRCLSSLVNQTYTNLEILLVDDGSSDSSGAICDKYADKYSRVKVFHIKNSGVSNARNFALDNMHGEYVTFVDSDDWLDVDWVEQAFNKVKEANVLLYIGGLVRTYPDLSEKINHKYMTCSLFTPIECLKEMYTKSISETAFTWEICGKLYHRDLWKNVRFEPGISMGEDALAFWHILKLVDKVLFVPVYNYHYFYREDSAVNSLKPKHIYDAFFVNKVICQESAYIMDNEVKGALKARFLNYRVKFLLFLSYCKYYEYDLSIEKYFLYKNIFQHFWCAVKLKGVKGGLAVLLVSLPSFVLKPLSRKIAAKKGMKVNED